MPRAFAGSGPRLQLRPAPSFARRGQFLEAQRIRATAIASGPGGDHSRESEDFVHRRLRPEGPAARTEVRVGEDPTPRQRSGPLRERGLTFLEGGDFRLGALGHAHEGSEGTQGRTDFIESVAHFQAQHGDATLTNARIGLRTVEGAGDDEIGREAHHEFGVVAREAAMIAVARIVLENARPGGRLFRQGRDAIGFDERVQQVDGARVDRKDPSRRRGEAQFRSVARPDDDLLAFLHRGPIEPGRRGQPRRLRSAGRRTRYRSACGGECVP